MREGFVCVCVYVCVPKRLREKDRERERERERRGEEELEDGAVCGGIHHGSIIRELQGLAIIADMSSDGGWN